MRSGRGGRIAALAAAAVLLTGCSGSDRDEPSSDGPEVAADVASDLARLYAGDHSTPDGRAEGRCFADAFLDRVTADDLGAAGILDANGAVVDSLPTLDRPIAEDWVAAQETCTSFLDASTEALRAQSKGAVDTDRYRVCLDRRLTTDELREAQIAALTGDLTADPVTALSDAQATCAGAALPMD